MGQHDEFMDDFLAESDENLDCLVQVLAALEEEPGQTDQLELAVRAVHTIKGSSGFFGLINIHVLARAAEVALAALRDGQPYQSTVGEMLMDCADGLREMLYQVQQTGSEGDVDYSALCESLQKFGASAPSGDSDPPR